MLKFGWNVASVSVTKAWWIVGASWIPKVPRIALSRPNPDPTSTVPTQLVGLIVLDDHMLRPDAMLLASSICVDRVHA